MSFEIGQVIRERYRISNLITQRGFSAVYQAWDLNLNSSVAIKENLDLSEAAVQQFDLEARMLATLRHDHLPYIVDHFHIPGEGQCLVMEYIEGEDLQSLVARTGHDLPEMQVLTWFEQICDALSYLHTQSPAIIHRDIKPVNIKITPQGRAVLVDYGIDKVDLSTQGRTVQSGMESSSYIPPEQYAGTMDIRSDIYALGATLYWSLTGTKPTESSHRQSGALLISPRQINPEISPKVDRAISRAMDLDPNQRFQSVQEFKTALGMPLPPYIMQSSVLSGDGMNQNNERPARSMNWLIWVVVALVGFCLIVGAAGAIGVYFYLAPMTPTPTEIRLDLYLTQTALAQQLASPIVTTEAPLVDTVTATLEPTMTPTLSPTVGPTLIQTLTPTLIPTITNTPETSDKWDACPGIYQSRLHVGDTAYVSTDPPLPNRVRTQPSKNALIIGFLQPGEIIDIIEGPSCSNKWIWWRVHSQETGMTGWTAEGDSDAYWLVPVK